MFSHVRYFLQYVSDGMRVLSKSLCKFSAHAAALKNATKKAQNKCSNIAMPPALWLLFNAKTFPYLPWTNPGLARAPPPHKSYFVTESLSMSH